MNDIPSIRNIFDHFQVVSGLKINFTKSELLPLTSTARRQWINSSPFQIAPSSLKYLGIRVGKTPNSLYDLNYPPLINKLKQQLLAWHNLPLSLMGRSHLVKMMIFPKLLYPLQTIPCLSKHRDVTDINRSITKIVSPITRSGDGHTKLAMVQPGVPPKARHRLDLRQAYILKYFLGK